MVALEIGSVGYMKGNRMVAIGIGSASEYGRRRPLQVSPSSFLSFYYRFYFLHLQLSSEVYPPLLFCKYGVRISRVQIKLRNSDVDDWPGADRSGYHSLGGVEQHIVIDFESILDGGRN